jgi:hypothetical protein
MRLTRNQMLEVLRQDYVRTARAKGLAERAVIVRHALKNAMIPVITVIGLQIGLVVSGTVIFETIFGIPGVGRFYFEAITFRDYPRQGITLVFATGVVLISDRRPELHSSTREHGGSERLVRVRVRGQRSTRTPHQGTGAQRPWPRRLRSSPRLLP